MQMAMTIIEIISLVWVLYVASKGFKKANWEYLLGLDIDAKEEEERRHVQHNIDTANAFASDKAA
ncbi:hypothetical protein [Secundilactobacillus kimchicus]|uniref:hypothetical protein n=1 Tax=Secundilactobacillus kimchicus TaxID=528209 RepID=UPI0024A999BD|nr:hypothetical protein [Secundilactobacillus kimchicus]